MMIYTRRARKHHVDIDNIIKLVEISNNKLQLDKKIKAIECHLYVIEKELRLLNIKNYLEYRKDTDPHKGLLGKPFSIPAKSGSHEFSCYMANKSVSFILARDGFKLTIKGEGECQSLFGNKEPLEERFENLNSMISYLRGVNSYVTPYKLNDGDLLIIDFSDQALSFSEQDAIELVLDEGDGWHPSDSGLGPSDLSDEERSVYYGF